MWFSGGKGGYFEKLSKGSKTSDLTSEGLGEVTLQTCAPENVLLMSMGGRANGQACADGERGPPSARAEICRMKKSYWYWPGHHLLLKKLIQQRLIDDAAKNAVAMNPANSLFDGTTLIWKNIQTLQSTQIWIIHNILWSIMVISPNCKLNVKQRRRISSMVLAKVGKYRILSWPVSEGCSARKCNERWRATNSRHLKVQSLSLITVLRWTVFVKINLNGYNRD